jgi:hypothetical protein
MSALRNKITEEDHVEFSKYSDLSYYDDEETNVVLLVNDKIVGVIDVWKDSEMDDREYICVNYEVIYLDTIKKV